jgi:hypothetical protein
LYAKAFSVLSKEIFILTDVRGANIGTAAISKKRFSGKKGIILGKEGFTQRRQGAKDYTLRLCSLAPLRENLYVKPPKFAK